MKISRILLILVMLFSISPINVNAQFLGKLFKKGTKTAIKKSGKEVCQDMAQRVIIKELGQTATKKSSKKLLKESGEVISERAIKSNLNSSFDDILRIGLVRNIDDIAIKSGTKITSQATKEVFQRATYKRVSATATETAQRHFKDILVKKTVKEVGEKAFKDQLVEILGERATKEWCERIAKEQLEDKSRILLSDLVANKHLRRLIKNNPNILNAYHRCIYSKSFRGDISILRYLDNGAGKFYKKGFRGIDAYGNGSNLVLREGFDGIAEIVDINNGELLGRISKDKFGKYLIDVPVGGNRTLLNLAPKANTVYTSGTNKWVTNSYGQVYKVEYSVTPHTHKVKAVRDNKFDTKMGTHKNLYNTEGKLAHSHSKYMPADDGGHLIAISNGGTSDFINYVPQNSIENRQGIWREAEKAAAAAAKKGKTVKCTIEILYPNKTTLRPSSFTRTHTIDGAYQKIKFKGNHYVLDGKTSILNELVDHHTPREVVEQTLPILK